MTTSRHNDYLVHLKTQLECHPHLRPLLSHYIFPVVFLVALALDAFCDRLAVLYCPTGQGDPYDPICMLRSWLLMTLLRVKSPDAWAKRLRREALLAVLAGFDPQKTPCATAHRDFLKRYGDGSYAQRKLQDKPLSEQLTGRHERRLEDATEARKKEAGPNNSQSQAVVDKLLKHADEHRDPNALQTRLENLFVELGLKPTLDAGILDNLDTLIASGDGTVLATAASSDGIRTCNCPPNSKDCDHKYIYTSATAQFCKDTHHDTYIFGDRSYTISIHQNGHDLPLITIMPGGNESDFTLAPKALDELLKIFREHELPMSLAIFIGDGHHDASAIYLYLKEKGIIPIIPLREWGKSNSTKPSTDTQAEHPGEKPAQQPTQQHTEKPAAEQAQQQAQTPAPQTAETHAETPTENNTKKTENNTKKTAKKKQPIHPHIDMYPNITFESDGTPLCPGGRRMYHHNYVPNKYAHFFKCPVKRKNRQGNWIFHSEECPLQQNCCSDPKKKMGYTLYIKSSADPRLLPPIPRDSKRFKTLYNERTSTERSNSVEDSYNLDHRCRNAVYGLIRLTFVNICKHAVVRYLEQLKIRSDAELLQEALARIEMANEMTELPN